MAEPFQPTFVDLVRNYTTTTGTGNFVLGAAVSGFESFTAACEVGDRFYYSALGIDKPGEREVGRGTLLAGGVVSRDPVSGAKTNFTGGKKTLALIAAAEWYSNVQASSAASASASMPAAAATRGALATASQRQPTILSEPGREGVFVWDGSDLAGKVAADPLQGIYVAPSSDPSGVSGAWVRKAGGPVLVTWFGAAGDNVTDDGPAAAAAIAFLEPTALSGFGFAKGALRLRFPGPRAYYLGTTTLELANAAITLEGDMPSGQEGGPTTVLRWAAGTTGIRVQTHNTAGANGTRTSVPYVRGDGSIIRNLFLKGGFSGTEGEAHGIHLRARATIENVCIDSFEGDGIYANASAGSGGATEGNVNNFRIQNVTVTSCRNGRFMAGADTNAGLIDGCRFNSNRQWGEWDSAFLGNTFVAPHVAGNGVTSRNDGVTIGASVVSYNGNRYYCKTGQATGASTNAPSGTAADNSWWGYISAGGPLTGMPAWFSGMLVREGGAYHTEDSSGAHLLLNPYSESGQGPAQLKGQTLVLGGQNGAGLGGYTGHIRVSDGILTTAGALQIPGVLTVTSGGSGFGPAGTAPAADNNFNLNTTNHLNTITGRNWSGGLPTTIGKIVFSDLGGSNGIQLDALVGAVRLKNNGSDVATVDASGINLQAGTAFKVNGTPVIDGSRNGSFAGIIATAAITSSGGGIGYAAGAGGAVVQLTDKSTAVTLNKPCGQVTTHNAALAANATATFTVSNSAIAASDTVNVNLQSGNATAGSYRVWAEAVAAGSFKICVQNVSGGSLGEALALNYSAMKAVTA